MRTDRRHLAGARRSTWWRAPEITAARSDIQRGSESVLRLAPDTQAARSAPSRTAAKGLDLSALGCGVEFSWPGGGLGSGSGTSYSTPTVLAQCSRRFARIAPTLMLRRRSDWSSPRPRTDELERGGGVSGCRAGSLLTVRQTGGTAGGEPHDSSPSGRLHAYLIGTPWLSLGCRRPALRSASFRRNILTVRIRDVPDFGRAVFHVDRHGLRPALRAAHDSASGSPATTDGVDRRSDVVGRTVDRGYDSSRGSDRPAVRDAMTQVCASRCREIPGEAPATSALPSPSADRIARTIRPDPCRSALCAVVRCPPARGHATVETNSRVLVRGAGIDDAWASETSDAAGRLDAATCRSSRQRP